MSTGSFTESIGSFTEFTGVLWLWCLPAVFQFSVVVLDALPASIVVVMPRRLLGRSGGGFVTPPVAFMVVIFATTLQLLMSH